MPIQEFVLVLNMIQTKLKLFYTFSYSDLGDVVYSAVKVKTYPAMWHEILDEIGKIIVWQDILGFIEDIFA